MGRLTTQQQLSARLSLNGLPYAIFVVSHHPLNGAFVKKHAEQLMLALSDRSSEAQSQFVLVRIGATAL